MAMGHNRLSIIDLSDAGLQPMLDRSGHVRIVFNGELYNYLELRAQLSDYPYRSQTDTEVVLAAYERWGEACLDRFIGMFAFLIWDDRKRRLFAARDRFGVKPLYYHDREDGTLLLASEIKALHAAGVNIAPDPGTWATYLAEGLYDHSERTFWTGIKALPAGHSLVWQDGKTSISCWYDLAERSGREFDERPVEQVKEEYLSLLAESVLLRFRSDVPVGINLSGGVDSSILLRLVHQVQGSASDIKAFTFITGDERYDELSWVTQMLERTRHPLFICPLKPDDVPRLAETVQSHQDEPFGGLPTLCYARLFERARQEGVIVLLDGQGMDEQWGGYDYYAPARSGAGTTFVQGTKESPVRAECLTPEFSAMSEPFAPRQPFPDRLRNMQYRDIRYTKIPRALRFNDRISMRSSTELREPFLDHRLLELALRQPPGRKILDGSHKWLLRQMANQLLPQGIVKAPKRALQTPQREWLRGPLRGWATDTIEQALSVYGGTWLDKDKVRAACRNYFAAGSDNSFYIWQWASLELMNATQHLTVQ
jgi:asparagine synthase (glutamine-hydrolysing)